MLKELWALWVLYSNNRCISCGNNFDTDKGRYIECVNCTLRKTLEKQAILEKKVTRAKEILFGN